MILGLPGEKGAKGDRGPQGKPLFDSMIYSDSAKHFKCHVPFLCNNAKCSSLLFWGEGTKAMTFLLSTQASQAHMVKKEARVILADRV